RAKRCLSPARPFRRRPASRRWRFRGPWPSGWSAAWSSPSWRAFSPGRSRSPCLSSSPTGPGASCPPPSRSPCSALTRPDGPIYTATAAAAIALGRGLSRESLALALRLCLLPAATYLGQLGFRLVYYGDYVPNPARVKVAFTSTRLIGGLAYTGSGFLYLSGLSLLGILAFAAVGDPQRRRRLLLLGLPLLAWSAYLSFIGGEIFPGRRHIVPIAVPLAFLATEGLAWAAARD